ncbi:N-acetylmuramoyl-L-alanine amidase [Stappia sp. MMSF_3263]|uniref:N-acetylmuramoyl-L-alanine amidase n=1 Tax=Stappia sp. MMSF_3263 TaxID=3046693 RepID=UPI00273F9888|nr:N-acetylmuramoyl-L-alanine amidase [Stappia sp. MMSF_3263]
MSVRTDTGLPARLRPSPNHNERQGEVRLLVLHYTGMATGEEAVRRLCDPAAEVSAHYVVEEDGGILQLVPESRRAWHAGKSFWKGERDINSRSIGIEMVNPGHEHGYLPFPEAQVAAVIDLSADICARHGIPATGVLAHSDVAPERKVDPGELFPWDRLAAAGICLHVTAEPVSGGRFFQEGDSGQPVEALQSMLALYGFEMPISGTFDARTRLAVAAFQRRHRRGRVDGIADMSTITTLHRFLQEAPNLG